MVLALIFLIIFLVLSGFSIYRSICLVKSPIVSNDYRSFFFKQAFFIFGACLSFLVMSFGFYLWLEASIKFIYVLQLIVGSILFSLFLLSAINLFIIHYYDKNITPEMNNILKIVMIISFVLSLIFFFVYTNGLAPYLTYPLVNGISFSDGFVSPKGGQPNIAFYAICILAGAVLVYFICDHFMYQKYGKHGILESTFYVAFPSGIIGARIFYVIGNYSVEFASRPFWHVFAIWEGGLTIIGGALVGIIVGVLFYIWRNKGKSVFVAIDIIVPCILIAQAVGRFGNFFNCEVHGLTSEVNNWKWLPEIIWRNSTYSSTLGFASEGMLYVPLFFIEAVANVFGYFFLTHLVKHKLSKYLEDGDLGGGYIIWYGLTRALMEPLRNASFQMGENGYWSWVWSLAFIFAGSLFIVLNHLIRYLINQRKGNSVLKNNKKDNTIACIVLSVISFSLLFVSVFLMVSNQFVAKVEYNGFNVGLIILIVSISILTLIAVPFINFRTINRANDKHEQI